MPWITLQAKSLLEKYLKKSDRVFEYGGGGSTLFLLPLVAELITVEHNAEWFQRLSELIGQSGFKNWQGFYVPPQKAEPLVLADKSDPAHYVSADPEFSGYNFFAYASAIDSYPDDYFAAVLVDGRARPSCAAHALRKIRRGGLLVIDNIERDYYLRSIQPKLDIEFRLVLDKVGPIPYLRHFTQTGIWLKL
jgi:hypothetical protein